MTKKKQSGWMIGSLVLAALLYVTMGGESYFFLYPSIDTRFAPGYSEGGFERVKVGMTKAEVLSLLGPPFDPGTVGQSSWHYTQDGKCFWADWAWLDRTVVFRDERVVEKIARIYYD
jgi:outer membrane protein assembly factor BamE (lipoprotein component of BamABCDE complex)